MEWLKNASLTAGHNSQKRLNWKNQRVRSKVRIFLKATRGPWNLLCKFCIRVFRNITKTTLFWGRSCSNVILSKGKVLSFRCSYYYLAFILLDNISIDPASPSCLVSDLIFLRWLLRRDSKSFFAPVWAIYHVAKLSLSMEVEFEAIALRSCCRNRIKYQFL